MVRDMLMAPLCPWQDGTGEFRDIVLDSRVRLNRNLKKYVFPDKASDTELSAVLDEAKGQLGTLNTLGQGHYRFISFEDLSPLEREVLAVKHLSSAGHIERPNHRGILLRDDGAVSIMVNEDDHFCIQVAAPGFDLRRVWDQAAQIDDALESHLDFAFRDDFGYLTASPSLTGTGLTVGVTLHVPALVLMKRFNRIVQGTTKFGFTFSGIYGERNDSIGNIFQITNQITLGVTEADTMEQLRKIVTQIVQEEQNCRTLVWDHNKNNLKDKWLRTWGTLSQAWLLDDRETLNFASDLRFGIDMGVIPVQPLAYEAIMAASDPAWLQLQAGSELSGEDLEHRRAQAVQQVLREYRRK